MKVHKRKEGCHYYLNSSPSQTINNINQYKKRATFYYIPRLM